MFYDLKAETPLTPLRERPFQDRDWEWLEDLLENDDDGIQQIVLGIQGLSCVACVWLVEAVAKKIPGVHSVGLSITRGSIELVYQPGKLNPSEFANSLYKLGYEIIRTPANSNESGGGSALAIKLGICGALAMNTMAFTLPRYSGMSASDELHELLTIIAIASSTLAFFIGGTYFFKRAWSALRLGNIHMDLPISIGLILAFLGSFVGWFFAREELFYFDFVAMFTFLMLLGKQAQQSSLSRANAKFGSENIIPDHFKKAGGEQVFTHDIAAGEQLIIPAGTVIPAASRLMSDAAECSLAWITGEPATLVYEKSDPIPAGAVNQSQDAITIETVEAVDTEHFFYQLPKQNDGLSPTLAKFIRYYLIAILFIGVIAAGLWLWMADDWVKSIQVMISIYVVSCPCAVGLALPLLDTRFNKLANNLGVFPLTTTCWAGFLKLKRVVFDKTGTLTLDRPTIENKEELTGLTDHEKQILFCLTKKSLHPLSRSIFSELIQQGTTHSDLRSEVTEAPGKGVSLMLDGISYSVERPNEDHQSISCVFCCDGQVIARFHFVESPREHTQEAISQLQKIMPQPPIILSGDVEQSVSKMANQLGIKDYAASLSPEQKLERICELQAKGDLLYIGDGMNDIPAMREARLSAAPFANINLVTKDVDFLFTDETLGYLPKLLSLATHRNYLSKLLLIFTTLYNIIVVVIAALGYMSPLIAAIIMPLSSLFSLFIVNRKKL